MELKLRDESSLITLQSSITLTEERASIDLTGKTPVRVLSDYIDYRGRTNVLSHISVNTISVVRTDFEQYLG